MTLLRVMIIAIIAQIIEDKTVVGEILWVNYMYIIYV